MKLSTTCLRYAEALPDEVVRLRDAGAMVYLPLGSLEWHDTHAPLGTDSVIAEGLSLRLAETTGGVVLPPLCWALTLADAAKPPYVWEKARGSLGLGAPDIWEAFLRSQVDALLRDGWQTVALVAGHAGSLEREILGRLAAEHAQPNQPQVALINLYQHVAGDHAGYFETSLLLALRPDSVQAAPSEGNPWARAPASAANARDGGQMVRECLAGALDVIQAARVRRHPLLPPPCPMLEGARLPAPWAAQWIAPDAPASDNFYFLARGVFSVPNPPSSACLHITADARYTAYLNGRRVGCGPARGSHRRYFVDTYDVGAWLRPGENWLAVAVHCPVQPTYNSVPHAPGLLAEIPGLIATGAAWEVRVDPAHNPAAPFFTRQLGYAEWQDLRLEPAGWTTGRDAPGSENTNSGAGRWQPARELAAAAEFGGRSLSPRPIPDLTWTERLPLRVIAAGRVPRLAEEDLAKPGFAEIMQAEMHFAAVSADFKNMDALARQTGGSTIHPAPGAPGAYVILDFGREIAGHLLLELEGPAGTIMDVGYDEGLDGGRLMTHRGAYRFADRFVLRAGRQTVNTQMYARGFRYVQLTFRGQEAPVLLHAVRAVERVHSAPLRAAWFCAGDLRLNRLWKACANTVRLCALDTFVDCIWREQAFWVNDFAVVNGYYLGLTGDGKFSAHNLRLAADGFRPDGLPPCVYPSDPVKSFPKMPALWALALADYHLYTGDLALMRALWPTLEKAMAWYDAHCGSDGLTPDQPDMWNFIDWGYRAAGAALAGTTAIFNMLVAAGYKQAAIIADAVGKPGRAQAWRDRSRDVVRALNAVLWNAARGCYRDCTRPAGAATASQHPLAVGLAFDLLEEPQRAAAAARLLDPDLIQAELYFQHFVLAALSALNRPAEALDVIRNLWGPMLEHDGDTIWESRFGRAAFQNYGSLCHAFACAPLRFLQETILGVRPLRPGFARFSINPQPAGLLGAWGIVPAPQGLIRVKWTQPTGGPLKLEAEVPADTVACMPDGRRLDAGRHVLEY